VSQPPPGPHGTDRACSRRSELLLFSCATSIELLFGLLLMLMWGTTFCSGDAVCHHYIPRLILETGDLRHLNVIWLPLLHLILIPLVRLDFLYTTGLAGTMVNAVATGLICVYLYRLAGGRRPALAAPMAFLCNIFTLIFGATPMMEQWAMAFSLMAVYHLRRYLSGGRAVEFLKCSTAFCLGCLTRYELWPPAALVALACLIREARSKRPGHLLLSPLPLAGPALWMGWNYYLTGDPLMFLHHPMGPQFWNRACTCSLSTLLLLAMAMIYASSGALCAPSAKQIYRLLRARNGPDLLVAFVLLFPAIFHIAIAATPFFYVSLRYFYMALPGFIFLAYLFCRGELGREAGLRPLSLSLVVLMASAYPLQVFALAYGMFPGIYFRGLHEHMVELKAIAEAVGDGMVLIGTDKAAWLSVLGGLSPSQIISQEDGCFKEAMEEPWRYVDFVVVVRMEDHPLLPAFNELYDGRFYIYLYYHDPSWRSDFLDHFYLVLATEHYLLFALRSQAEMIKA